MVNNSICLVNGQPLPTTGTTGANVSGGSTVAIQLANSAGIQAGSGGWTIQCTSTDGTNPGSTPALVNATLAINYTNFSATFTAPVRDGYAGATMIFTSMVNAGTPQFEISTFGVFVLNSNGTRLFAGAEQFESNATVGCAADLNNQAILTASGIEAGAGIITVANAVALTALSAPSLVQGALAFVQSRGTYWSFQPLSNGAGLAAGYAILSDNDGYWEYAGSGIINDAQTQATWYVDPVAGSDDNLGTSGSPLETPTEILRRWGPTPILNQATQINFVNSSSIPFAIDASGSGTLILAGVAPQQIFHGNISGLTQSNYVAGNLTNFAEYTGAAVGQLVYNITRNGYAWVYAITGGNVYLSAQILAASTPPALTLIGGIPGSVQYSWVTGDTISVYQPIQINLTGLSFKPTTVPSGATASAFIYQLWLTETTNNHPSINFDNVLCVESKVDGSVYFERTNDDFYQGAINTNFTNRVMTTDVSDPEFSGGIIDELYAGAVGLYRDVILASNFHFTGAEAEVGFGDNGESSSFRSGVWLAPGSQIQNFGSSEVLGVLWGGGQFDTEGACYFSGTSFTQQLLTVITLSNNYASYAYVPFDGYTILSSRQMMVAGSNLNLQGTFHTTNGSPDVSAGVSQTGVLYAGDSITFSTQPQTIYEIGSVSGTTIVLTTNFAGVTSVVAVGSSSPMDRAVSVPGGFGGVASAMAGTGWLQNTSPY